jgi:archaemetzincin
VAHGRCPLSIIQNIQYIFCRSPNLDIISNFCDIFFPGCRTEILPSIDFDNKMKKRINPYTKQPQYLVSNLIAHLKTMQRKRRNRQELFSIGVTMIDIYPDAAWNFVYGSASIDEGIGIYSFARFDPLFPHSSLEILQRPCTEDEQVLILKRAISTCLHEIMHLFGLEHCIYYLCLMNGANCEKEMDSSLLYLCPICLRKMYSSFGKQHYNVIKMYKEILELLKKVGFRDEVNWYDNRLTLLDANS